MSTCSKPSPSPRRPTVGATAAKFACFSKLPAAAADSASSTSTIRTATSAATFTAAPAIGADIDGPAANPNLLNARQFKIAWPTAASEFDFNAAYAVWNGKTWTVQYRDDGCPKILAGVQAPGPARYKLYFSRHVRPGAPTDPRIATKPVQILYADPERSGNPVLTDFDDWKPVDLGRDVHFLWPDGTPLTDDEESRFDDFVVFVPGRDPTRLIMDSDMSFTGLNAVPFLGSAVLINS